MSEFSHYAEGLHEECGVFGIYDKTGATDMVSAVYSALYALQHRGQESCGIAVNDDGVITGHGKQESAHLHHRRRPRRHEHGYVPGEKGL